MFAHIFPPLNGKKIQQPFMLMQGMVSQFGKYVTGKYHN